MAAAVLDPDSERRLSNLCDICTSYALMVNLSPLRQQRWLNDGLTRLLRTYDASVVLTPWNFETMGIGS